MKKYILLLPVLAICLVGCGEKEGTIVCDLSSKDVVNGYELKSTYKINYNGDFVETEEIVISDSDDLLNTFETTLNDTYKKTNDAYGGYTYNIVKENNQIVSNVTIDYSKMNLEQFAKDQPALKSYIKDNKMLTEGIQSLYESMGATCK